MRRFIKLTLAVLLVAAIIAMGECRRRDYQRELETQAPYVVRVGNWHHYGDFECWQYNRDGRHWILRDGEGQIMYELDVADGYYVEVRRQ